MYTVFLTGSIASGKSYAGSRLHDTHHIERIDLDQISRDVLSLDTECVDRVVASFGSDILDSDGAIDRSALAKKAFASDEALTLLEDIELPYIKNRMLKRISELKDQGCKLCFIEIPVLDRFEDSFQVADQIVCILADRKIRLERAVVNRNMTTADFYSRDEKQPSETYLKEHSDVVITNNSNQEDFDNKIDDLAHDLQYIATRI